MLTLHRWCVPEYPIEHFLFRHLEAILMRYLLLDRGACSVASFSADSVTWSYMMIFIETLIVLSEEFKELKLLPKLLLLAWQVIPHHFKLEFLAWLMMT